MEKTSEEEPMTTEDVKLGQSTYGSCPHDTGEGASQSVIQRIFPAGLKREIKELGTLAWPIALSSFFFFACSPIALIFCGHLGKTELDAAALATSTVNATGVFVCAGLSMACDTVFSQAYGGENMKMMGILLQRSLMITCLTCCVCWSLHLNAEPVLLLLHQDKEISRLAAEYMLYFTPGLMCNFIFQVLMKFLQTQNIVIPVVLLGFIANAFNVLAQYILVYKCDLKTSDGGYLTIFMYMYACSFVTLELRVISTYPSIWGSAIAQASSWLFACLTTFAYIRFSGILQHTWEGWSWKALEDWGYFFKLGLGGMVMTLAELCTIESGIFLNGIFGTVEQGAMSISLQIDWCLYVITLGLGTACSIRVGHYLGSGDSKGAKTAYRTSLLTLFCLNGLMTIALICAKDVAGLLFTNNREILKLVSRILPILAFVQVSDIVTGVCSGALRGCGQQWKGGVLNFTGYIFVAVPAIVIIMFFTDIGAIGFWWGIFTGMVPITFGYLIIMTRMDWDNEAIVASTRQRESQMNTLTEKIRLDNGPDDNTNGSIPERSVSATPLMTVENSHLREADKHLYKKRVATCIIIGLILFVPLGFRLTYYAKL